MAAQPEASDYLVVCCINLLYTLQPDVNQLTLHLLAVLARLPAFRVTKNPAHRSLLDFTSRARANGLREKHPLDPLSHANSRAKHVQTTVTTL
jgi:hypothetical protein